MESRLWPDMRRMGRQLPAPVTLFSGFDDEYNTIEGLGHSGIAWQLRRQTTDFGSGAKRLFGSMKKLLSATREETLQLLREMPQRFGVEMISSPAKFIEKVASPTGKSGSVQRRLHEIVLRRQIISNVAAAAPTQQSLRSGGPLSMVAFFDERRVYEAAMKLGLSEREAALVLPVVKFHEVGSESHHLVGRLTRKEKRLGDDPFKRQKALVELVSAKKGSHISGAVVPDELLIAAKLGPETYAATRKFRMRELEDLTRRTKKILRTAERAEGGVTRVAKWAKGTPLEASAKKLAEKVGGNLDVFLEPVVKQQGHFDYVLQTRRMIGKFEHHWLPKIAASSKEWNTIVGMQEGGLAEWLRKQKTPFGSPWDPLRAIAKEVVGVTKKSWARNAAKLSEEAYTSFLEGAAFQRTLAQGKVVRTAGEGGFGRVELMETTFGGKKFQYVRKTPLGQEAVAGAYGEYRKMRQLQAFGVPTPYGLVTAGPAKGTMYMEYIPGEEAKELWKTGRLTREHAQQIESVLGEAHVRGFAHFDIWRRVEGGQLRPQNVMVTPQGQVAVIDWGAAKPARQTVESMRREGPAMGHPGILSDLSLWPMTAAETDLMLGESLNRQLGAAVNRASQQVAPVAPDVLSGVASVVGRRAQGRVIPPQEQAVVQASLSARNIQQRHADLSQILRRDQERVWNNARSGGSKHRGPEAFASTVVRDAIVDAIGFANTLIR